MLLAVDIGNSMVNLGVFDGETLVANLRVSTDARRSSDEYGLMIRDLLALNGVERSTITDVCMCSVVPPLTGIFEELFETYFHVKSLSITAGVRTGLQISYDNPRDVGADRIADAVAAINLYGKPVIIVDFGTATVFDAISKDGIYLGGAIAPGINVAAEALFLNTSQLRRVELVAPKSAIGQNTSTALQAGLVLGYAGLVTGLVERFKAELGEEAKVIGTGGLATIISKEADIFDDINQDLTLIGLHMIYNMNQTK
jgi:type III pantothenate kinase|tara:strand:- start:1339 stop:2109 length:771 start_codon:yes stop_codon:yes gene_type:complete